MPKNLKKRLPETLRRRGVDLAAGTFGEGDAAARAAGPLLLAGVFSRSANPSKLVVSFTVCLPVVIFT